jgi:hypothetical protein
MPKYAILIRDGVKMSKLVKLSGSSGMSPNKLELAQSLYIRTKNHCCSLTSVLNWE